MPRIGGSPRASAGGLPWHSRPQTSPRRRTCAPLGEGLKFCPASSSRTRCCGSSCRAPAAGTASHHRGCVIAGGALHDATPPDAVRASTGAVLGLQRTMCEGNVGRGVCVPSQHTYVVHNTPSHVCPVRVERATSVDPAAVQCVCTLPPLAVCTGGTSLSIAAASAHALAATSLSSHMQCRRPHPILIGRLAGRGLRRSQWCWWLRRRWRSRRLPGRSRRRASLPDCPAPVRSTSSSAFRCCIDTRA